MEMIENICPISERRYEELPVDKIKVINSRNRDKDQFEMNVESIDSVGLLKPIRAPGHAPRSDWRGPSSSRFNGLPASSLSRRFAFTLR